MQHDLTNIDTARNDLHSSIRIATSLLLLPSPTPRSNSASVWLEQHTHTHHERAIDLAPSGGAVRSDHHSTLI